MGELFENNARRFSPCTSVPKHVSQGAGGWMADISASWGWHPIPRRWRPARRQGGSGLSGEFRNLSTSETTVMLGSSFSPARDRWFLLPQETIYLLPSLPSRLLPSFPGRTCFCSHDCKFPGGCRQRTFLARVNT